jgi:hypothetical protein
MTSDKTSAHLELTSSLGVRRVILAADRVTVGADESSDVAIPEDPTVSRLHAVFERYGNGWCVRDLGSHNGTFVNGQRILGERVLRSRDELRIGDARIVYWAGQPEEGVRVTAAGDPAPELTRREREILVALCRPVLAGDVFTEPASSREIAEALVVSEAAVKQHLLRLYDKFGIHDSNERRRVKLANMAVHRGAVALADLRT